MRVLVTGGTGFIGGHVARGLLNLGHVVVALDYSPNAEFLSDVADRLKIIQGEVQDLSNVLDVIKRFEITHVVHTASLLTSTSQKKPVAALNVNVLGTVNILEAARLMDVAQVTYMSSTAVYGYTKKGEVIQEDHPQSPVTIYGATKLLCEHYGLAYNTDNGLGFMALRFPIVYGPGQSTRGFSAFKEIVEKPVAGEKAVVPVGGDQEYDGIYVKDAAEAIISACFATKTKHKVFNIGTGIMITIRDLASEVRKIIPQAEFEIGPGVDIAEPVKGPMDISRAKEELGFKPKFNLEKGVKDYVTTLKERTNLR